MRTSLLFFASLIVAQCSARAQGTLTITFDGNPLPPSGQRYVIVSNYQESGIGVYCSGDGHGNYGFIHTGAEEFSNYPYNGTPYVQGEAFVTGYFVFTAGPANSGPLPLFGVSSIDLAGLDGASPDYDVYFVGRRSDGSSLSEEVSGTGLNFQTFHFGSEWSSGLSSLQMGTVSPTGWSADNLVVIVPEPATGRLLALGAGTFSFWQCRRRKTRT